MDYELFVFDSSYLNSSTAPAPERERHDHKNNEKPLTAKEWNKKDFEVDIDYIIEIKPKPKKVIEFFQACAEKLNDEYFQ